MLRFLEKQKIIKNFLILFFLKAAVDRVGKQVVAYEIHNSKTDKPFESINDSQKKPMPSNVEDDLYNDETF